MICCHDAGGAEILSEWVLADPSRDYSFWLQGPAAAVFRRKIPGLTILEAEAADVNLGAVDFVLTGTSWGSTLELDCLTRARNRGVFSASFVDHWVNYAARFRFPGGGAEVFPDELWTGDPDGFALACATFPGRVIRQQVNPYFEAIRNSFAKMSLGAVVKHEARLLYVCEPIAIDCAVPGAPTRPSHGYTEFDALAFFLDRVPLMVGRDIPVSIRVRLHPSEKKGKYEPVLSRYRAHLHVEVSEGTTLMEDCVWSTAVIGCGSMAMVIALLGSREVYSSIPVRGIRCPLPQREIRYLRDLDDAKSTGGA